MNIRNLILTVIALAMVGCATEYQTVGFTGGYSESWLSDTRARIRYDGNGFSTMERIQDFAVLRAADLGASRAFTHLVVVSQKATTEQLQRGSMRPCVVLLIDYYHGSPAGMNSFCIRNIQQAVMQKYELRGNRDMIASSEYRRQIYQGFAQQPLTSPSYFSSSSLQGTPDEINDRLFQKYMNNIPWTPEEQAWMDASNADLERKANVLNRTANSQAMNQRANEPFYRQQNASYADIYRQSATESESRFESTGDPDDASRAVQAWEKSQIFERK